MRAPVGSDEGRALLWREVADIENQREMDRGNWRWVGWIGDLRHEAAVRANRLSRCEPSYK